jgi:hypothetical protein
MCKLPKVAFIKFDKNGVQNALTIDVADSDELLRKLLAIQEEGCEKVIAVYGEGGIWTLNLPRSPKQLIKDSTNIYRNIID